MQPLRLKHKARKGSETLLARSQEATEPYDVVVCERLFRVHLGVFSPKYFRDTEFFARSIKLAPGESFCEIGPGTGAISVTMAIKGASRVVAVDINPLAVANTRENAEHHGVSSIVTVHEGSVFEPLSPSDRFDCIFWNVPFCFVPEDEPLTTLQRAICEPGYHGVERYIREAHHHLRPNGRLLIGFSTTIGHKKLVEQLLAEAGYTYRQVSAVWGCQVERAKYNLFEARRKPSCSANKEGQGTND